MYLSSNVNKQRDERRTSITRNPGADTCSDKCHGLRKYGSGSAEQLTMKSPSRGRSL